MNVQAQAKDLIMRLCDRPEAGVAKDSRGNLCVYCGDSAHAPAHVRLPEHRRDCPILAGKELLRRIYGPEE